MVESIDWNGLRVEHEGGVYAVPCLAFTLWVRTTDTPLLLDFYERSMEAIGPLLTHYLAESMKQPAKVTARARTMVPTWLRKPAELKTYHMQLRGSAEVHGTSLEVIFQSRPPPTPAQEEQARRNLPILVEQGFMNSGVQTSTFRVTLALDHPLAEPGRFARWVLGFKAVAEGEFVTAGCDYSINYDDRTHGFVDDRVRALCARYPGLDYFDSSIHLWLHRYEEKTQELLPLSKRAGWMTFLNRRSVEWLGGEVELAEALRSDPDVELHPLARGLALQSGAAPRLGDVTRGDIPYRAVASAVRPVRIERKGQEGYDDEWMRGWFSVLDGAEEAR